MRKWIASFMLFCCLLLPVCQVSASELYTNTETDYVVIIEDDADLLTADEENNLIPIMQGITAYGNVALKTINDNPYDTNTYAYNYYEDTFGSTSGTILLIDMDNREICIHSSGYNYQIITDDYGNTITDNIYRYASNGDYFSCCSKAFEQVLTLLQGSRIAQPMKYICNALLSIIAALLITYLIVRYYSTKNRVSKNAKFIGVENHFLLKNPSANKTKTSKVYSPVNENNHGSSRHYSGGGHSGGSHYSGGSHSSGGHSGGGHSGGGGSHRF